MDNPKIISEVFNQEDFNKLRSLFSDITTFDHDEPLSRYLANEGDISQLSEYLNQLVPLAREVFDSNTLLPTYALFSHYYGPDAHLPLHKDDNACTYTIDVCLYQGNSWDLWIEGKPYSISENQAIAFYGNDQNHWRDKMPKDTGVVGMIFFHFAEPENWFFTKGPEYIRVIRNEILEEDFVQGRQPRP